jgi:hypothetical protein
MHIWSKVRFARPARVPGSDDDTRLDWEADYMPHDPVDDVAAKTFGGMAGELELVPVYFVLCLWGVKQIHSRTNVKETKLAKGACPETNHRSIRLAQTGSPPQATGIGRES